MTRSSQAFVLPFVAVCLCFSLQFSAPAAADPLSVSEILEEPRVFHLKQVVLQGTVRNVQPLDPITFVAVPVVLIVTAAIAVAAPAWRAARVDPVVAFRAE